MRYKNSKKEEVIEQVLTEFNFEKVRKVMLALDWRWVTSKENGVPSVYEIIRSAREYCVEAVNGTEKNGGILYSVASGGLRASAVIDEGELFLRLSFEVEYSDNHY